MRTARLAREYPIRLRYTLFPLHPDTPPEGLTLEELFGERVDLDAARVRMQRLMEQGGLPYGERTHTYNSRLAQELAKWAEAQPGGGAIHDALYRAYFVDGVNLAETEQLVRVASDVGLSPDGAQEVLRNRTHAEEVDRDWRRARELGVTGVPTFVVGRHGVVGAQPYEVLERLITGAERRRNGADRGGDRSG